MSENLYKDLSEIQSKLKSKEDISIHDDINVFSLLNIQDKEVLMCRMLGTILDPHGGMNEGEDKAKSVRLFVRDVLGVSDDPCEDASVTLEDKTDLNRRCDILIQTQGEKNKYPIEVKINAGDQDFQLFDYYVHYFGAANREGMIYYLTLSGKDPSLGSIKREGYTLKKEEQFKTIGFDKLEMWLKELDCSENTIRDFLIKQYKEAIMNLREEERKKKELLDALNIEDWKKCQVSNSLTSIVGYSDFLWKEIVCSYLESCIRIPAGYNLKRSNDVERKHELLVVEKDGDRICGICVDTNLYIVSEYEVDNGKEWTDKSWKYIVPVGYGKKKYPLKGADVTNCYQHKDKIIPIEKELEYIKQSIEKRKQ